MLIEEQLRERLKAKLEEACRRDFAKDKIGILQQAPFSRKLTPAPEAPARIAVTVVSVRHPAPPRATPGRVANLRCLYGVLPVRKAARLRDFERSGVPAAPTKENPRRFPAGGSVST
jgi:hypothetical protein